jgi:hypothetical protein
MDAPTPSATSSLARPSLDGPSPSDRMTVALWAEWPKAGEDPSPAFGHSAQTRVGVR